MAKAINTTPRNKLARLPRGIIHAAIEALLEELDRRDGDPDWEDSHDAEEDCGAMDNPGLTAPRYPAGSTSMITGPVKVPGGVYTPCFRQEVRHG